MPMLLLKFLLKNLGISVSRIRFRFCPQKGNSSNHFQIVINIKNFDSRDMLLLIGRAQIYYSYLNSIDPNQNKNSLFLTLKIYFTNLIKPFFSLKVNKILAEIYMERELCHWTIKSHLKNNGPSNPLFREQREGLIEMIFFLFSIKLQSYYI